MNTEELKNVSLSEATMRTEDLIPRFISALRQIDPENIGLMKSLEEVEATINICNYPYYESRASQLDLDYLFDTLDAYAPEGFYFGAHPGDGSDYGFWECEDFEVE